MKSRFVVHEHHASQLHFDFRLEINGVLKSWAVPKGVSLNPREKRLAVEVTDHAVSYIDFEGEISAGKYGAGKVFVWDSGEFEADDPPSQLAGGKLRFVMYGRKLRGEFVLLKIAKRARQWLLIKSDDDFADKDWQLEIVFKSDL